MPTLCRDDSAGYLTNWAARLYARAIDRELASIGLSSAHLPVLFALDAGTPLAQKALAEIAAVEQPTMAATLARMERDGLVERLPHPSDRRSSLFRLSEAARSRMPATRAAIDRVNAAGMTGASAQEQAQHRAMLRSVVASLEAFLR
ncbi:MAG: MarR family winged helix-turn-helix transcriptional regulator [Pseudomonadota bacterium]